MKEISKRRALLSEVCAYTILASIAGFSIFILSKEKELKQNYNQIEQKFAEKDSIPGLSKRELIDFYIKNNLENYIRVKPISSEDMKKTIAKYDSIMASNLEKNIK